ncbi:MAG: recombinase family protein, partial [Clostridia bacterium]|nr:recombinase family protein [Clostridia bacterium]
AQEESLSVSEICKWRIRNGFLEGKTTSFRMLGYKVVNGELIVVPEEVATVKRIFDMYLAGYGIQTIANTLTAEGYPTVFGGDWHPYKVGAILDNEKYCGDLILQKTYRNNHIEKKKLRNTGQLQQVFIEDDHEAIIKKDVFRTVAEKRQRRSTNKGVRRECTALTGMIRCPYCGKNYRRKSAARCIKWCCATFNTKGKKFCPESKMIPEDTVIEAVCAVLNMDEYDEREFLDCVDHIDACKGNTLRFYSSFLGYDKGPNGELVVNEKQAVIVRRIYDDFLSGLTPYTIAKRLTEEGIETPAHKKVWHQSTVYSILKNEKYYGAAILQKKITLDFLNKKQVKNTGQLGDIHCRLHERA